MEDKIMPTGEVAKLQLKLGDILIFRTESPREMVDLDNCHGWLREMVPPGVKVMVLCAGESIDPIHPQVDMVKEPTTAEVQ